MLKVTFFLVASLSYLATTCNSCFKINGKGWMSAWLKKKMNGLFKLTFTISGHFHWQIATRKNNFCYSWKTIFMTATCTNNHSPGNCPRTIICDSFGNTYKILIIGKVRQYFHLKSAFKTCHNKHICLPTYMYLPTCLLVGQLVSGLADKWAGAWRYVCWSAEWTLWEFYIK